MTINWQKLCEDSHTISLEKGWQEIPRTYEEDVALFHSELSEALEDYRANHSLTEIYYEGEKPCGIPIELADFIIRICQYCGTNRFDFAWHMKGTTHPVCAWNLPKLVAKCHWRVSKFFEISEDEEISEGIFMLAGAVGDIIQFCKENSIDIEHALAIKEAYNRTRPHRHGGKKL